MEILCPHCQNRIESKQLADEVLCPACGSSFHLDRAATTDWKPRGNHRRLGKFELIDQVGMGAFGTVYKARDTELDRIVAIKVPRGGHVGSTGGDTDRFLREARSVAQLRHPSIVAVHEVGQHDSLPYLVSDFVAGITLADLLTSRRLAPRQAAKLISQVADALEYAHSQGVVHRDVKPSNIMLDDDLTPHVMDFGLAKRDAGEVTMTVEGQVLGTPAYTSPEQARGESHKVDGRSDVYSLGVMLYELLAGELPFRGNVRMLLHQVLHDEPRSVRSLNDRIPRDLETVCLKAMAKEPAKRYATARDLADELRRWLAGEPIQARPVGRAEKAWRWCRRNPVVASLTAALVLVVVAGFAGVTWKWRDAEQQKEIAGEQRQIAVAQADIAKSEAEKSRRLLYTSDMNVALQEYSDGDFDRVLNLLDRHRPREGEEDLRGLEWYHIWKLCKPGITAPVLRHDEPLFAMNFSPDGKELATASHHWVTIWEVKTQRKVNSFRIANSFVWDVEYSPDGKSLACATNQSVQLLDTQTGAIETLSPFDSRFVAFSPDGKILAFNRHPVLKLYSLMTKQELVHPLSNKVAIDAAFSPSGNLLATDSSSGMTLWDLKSGQEFRHFEKNGGRISFSRDGQLVAARSNTHVRLWNVNDGKKLIDIGEELNNSYDTDSTVAVSPDKTTLAADGLRNTIKIRDIRTGELLATLSGHSGGPKSIKFSPDGQLLASAAYDGTVRLWTLPIRAQRTILAGHRVSTTSSPTFSRDGSSMAALSQTGVNIWDTSTWSLRATIPIKPQFAAALSPDGNTIAGIVANKVELWDVKTSQLRLSYDAAESLNQRYVPFSPDGRRLLFGARGSVFVWDLLAGSNPVATPLQGGGRKTIFSPDGRFIARVGRDVQLWDSTSEDGPRKLSDGEPDLFAAAFSPDGRLLATGGSDRTITLWDVETGAERARIPAAGHVYDLAFSPDARTLASAAGTLSVRLYDIASKQLRGQLRTESPTRSVAFAPDGKSLLSGLTDGSIQIWHVADEAEVRATGW